jgi:hypothetical protein
MVRANQPDRTGLPPKQRKDGRTYTPTNPVVDKIIKLPWEKKGKGKAAAKEEDGADPRDKAVEFVMAHVEKPIDKKKLAGLAFNELKKEGYDDFSGVAKLILDDKFHEGQMWTLDKKGMVSME